MKIHYRDNDTCDMLEHHKLVLRICSHYHWL